MMYEPRAWRYLTVGLAVPLTLLLVLVIQQEWPLRHLLADPAETHQFPPLHSVGTLAYLVAWIGAASVAMTAWLARRQRWFLVLAGLSLYLGIDDALLLHENVLPHYLGIPESVSLVVLAIVGCLFVTRFRRQIGANRPDVLVGAAMLFGLSMAADSHRVRAWFGLPTHDEDHWVATFVEDGAKLLGTWVWATWVTLAVVTTLRVVIPQDERYTVTL